MRIILALILGLCGLVAGFSITAPLAYWLAGLAGMSDFEGGRGMFAGLVAAPIGAIVGFIGGIIAGWLLGRERLTPNAFMLVFLIVAVAFGSALMLWQGG